MPIPFTMRSTQPRPGATPARWRLCPSGVALHATSAMALPKRAASFPGGVRDVTHSRQKYTSTESEFGQSVDFESAHQSPVKSHTWILTTSFNAPSLNEHAITPEPVLPSKSSQDDAKGHPRSVRSHRDDPRRADRLAHHRVPGTREVPALPARASSNAPLTRGTNPQHKQRECDVRKSATPKVPPSVGVRSANCPCHRPAFPARVARHGVLETRRDAGGGHGIPDLEIDLACAWHARHRIPCTTSSSLFTPQLP